MHTRSGLLAAIEASTISLADAGAATLEFLRQHLPPPEKVPLAGNSIGTDRRFLAAHLPEVENYLHYRSVDVSTIKELVRRWYPESLAGAPPSAPTTGPWTTSVRAWPSWPTTAKPSSAHRHRPTHHRRRRPRPGPRRPPGPAKTSRDDRPGPAERLAAGHEPGRGHRHPHRTRAALRNGGDRHPRRGHPGLEVGAAVAADRPRPLPRLRRRRLPGLRGRAHHLRPALPARRHLGPPAPGRLRDRKGRPGGHRHAQPPRMGRRLLGGGRGRRRGGPAQRLVDRRGAGYGLADSGAVVAFVDAERAHRLRPHLADLADLRAIVVADEHRGATSAETGGRAAGGTAELSFPEVLGARGRPTPSRPRWTSNPTTTPPSSTPRAPPAARRGQWAPIATPAPT